MIFTVKNKHGLFEVLVDDDCPRNIWDKKWSIAVRKNCAYVIRSEYAGKINGKYIYKHASIHRQLTNCPAHLQVDHINGNSLDNRMENLRIVSRSQNLMNQRQKIGKYKGVIRSKKLFVAQIGVKGKNLRLGSFETIEEAAKAYNEAALKYFGEFARLNNIKEK